MAAQQFSARLTSIMLSALAPKTKGDGGLSLHISRQNERRHGTIATHMRTDICPDGRYCGTNCPFAALRRFRLFSDGHLPCWRRVQQANC